jgi:tetratricopeptide (TPR) repeat protein
VLLERGDLDAAAGLAEGVRASESTNPRAALILARVAAARGDWQVVLDRITACADDPSAARDAALLRGQAFAARGEGERSAAEFRRADQLPRRTWPDPLVEEVERLRVGVAARLGRAVVLIEQGHAGEAVLLLEDVVAQAPNDASARLLLGRALIGNRNAPAARRVLEEFSARHPDSVEGWFNLGVARFLVGDHARAADAFRTALKLKPDHALAHYNLGHCHKQLGDKSAAKAAFEEALRCRPDYQAARDALADLAAGK